MSLAGILSNASSGISSIGAQLALVSQNVANANTPDYTREVAQNTSVTAGGVGMGVATQAATRAIDVALQSDLFQQNSGVAGLQTTQTALQAIDSVQGTPGQGNDISSLLGAVQDAFSTLANDPSSTAQQTAVVNAAGNLTQQINAVSTAIGQQRQAAEDGVATGVAAINANLATIGSISDQIIATRAVGQSTADLENQRDAAMDSLSQQIDVKFLAQPNGDMLVLTPSGLQLPIHGTTPVLQTTDATLNPTATYPGTIPAVTLGGTDVTQMLAGGQLGANIALRDTLMPTLQANLDEFAQTLSTRFAQQGLTLFSDAAGNVPAGGGTPVQSSYVGYASQIQVNALVVQTPSDVRDGTQPVAGGGAGASAFTPNPAGGPAGFSTLITRVLDYAFGSQVQLGVAQPAPNTTGLGPSGTLSAGFAAPPDLAGLATAVVSQEAAQSGTATASLGNEQSVQTALQTKLAASGSVSIDTEMSSMVQLQNAYGANARVITAVQALFADILQMVT